jgi:hypothetical protein
MLEAERAISGYENRSTRRFFGVPNIAARGDLRPRTYPLKTRAWPVRT